MPSDALLNDLSQLVTNELPARLPNTVAFIVGSNPSKGARSPRLWNAAFDLLGIDGEMYPLDVGASGLEQLASLLEHDSRVVGVAIAAPYKAEFAKLFEGRLTVAAARSGSINLLSRAENGRFAGSNTDGLAAVDSLLELKADLADENILVLGCGATGRAVIASLIDVVGCGRITVAYRDPQHTEWLQRVGVKYAPIGDVSSLLGTASIVVNCTSVGWGAQVDLSPLTISDLGRIPSQSLIFDVVYQPDPSKLLRDAESLGLRTLSGSRMNLLQAVVAFCTSNPTAVRDRVVEAMRMAAA